MRTSVTLEGGINQVAIWVRSHLPDRPWDWQAAALTVALLLMSSGRLLITDWVPSLEIVQTLSLYAVVLGLALGYSAFSTRNSVWIVAEYGCLIIPSLLMRAIERPENHYEGLRTIVIRLADSLRLFLASQPVYDTLFFLTLTSLGFWIIGAYTGYFLTRYRKFLNIVFLPGLAMLVIQIYDPWITLRAWGFAAYIFTSLALLGRLHFLERRETWRKKRVFLSTEAEGEMSRTVLAVAAFAVFTAWILPAALKSIQPASEAWEKFTEPITERLSDAVSALDSPYGTSSGGDFYGSNLKLGSSAPVSDTPVFYVQIHEPNSNILRYYWRGRVYAHYEDGAWSNTGNLDRSFDPQAEPITLNDPTNRIEVDVTVTSNFPRQNLLYAPSEMIWVDRQSRMEINVLPGSVGETMAWFTIADLAAGDSFQARSMVTNPSIRDLQEAGTDYPEWITEEYLQVPDEIAPRLKELAAEIAAPFDTPYGKVRAITSFLRNEIAYETNITEGPPQGNDPLLWVLFEYKKGFCMYYASAEVLMLRTLGIPARMVVGFSQGEFDTPNDQYVVTRLNSHAWPEVYFPRIGWVEFEPTANQDPLNRRRGRIEADGSSVETTDPNDPSVSAEDPTGTAQNRRDVLDDELEILLDLESRNAATGVPDQTAQVNPWLRTYVAGFFLVLLAIALFLERRYSLTTQIPAHLVKRYESGGDQPPRWISNWAKWVELLPIERYFHVIDIAMKSLGKIQPFYSTPAVRARILKELLPSARKAIENLEHQHESALFTSRAPDLSAARRAAVRILFEMWRTRWIQRLEYLKGRYN